MKVLVDIVNIYNDEKYTGYADYDKTKDLTNTELVAYMGFNTDNHRIEKREQVDDVSSVFNDDLLIAQERQFDETE